MPAPTATQVAHKDEQFISINRGDGEAKGRQAEAELSKPGYDKKKTNAILYTVLRAIAFRPNYGPYMTGWEAFGFSFALARPGPISNGCCRPITGRARTPQIVWSSFIMLATKVSASMSTQGDWLATKSSTPDATAKNTRCLCQWYHC